MNRKHVIDLFSQLTDGPEYDGSGVRSETMAPEVQSLLDLASSLQAAMVPVPNTYFEQRLRGQLMRSPVDLAAPDAATFGSTWWFVAALVGASLSILGFAYLVSRTIRGLMSRGSF
jgi:hypothetical protein